MTAAGAIAAQVERVAEEIAAARLEPLEAPAGRALSGASGGRARRSPAWIYAIRGDEAQRLVRKLSHAANRASAIRRDTLTDFAFRGAGLVAELRKGGGVRIAKQRERDGITVVLADPGYGLPWPRPRDARG